MNKLELEEIGLGSLLRWRKLATTPDHSGKRAAPAAGGPARTAEQSRTVKILQDKSRNSPAFPRDVERLAEQVHVCTKCELCKSRTNAVFGVGDTSPGGIMVVGEGPGEQEDLQGEPFVGSAGNLLDAMLDSIGLKRGKKVFITNVVKCRPPRNRTPAPLEIASCQPYLEQQIEMIRPRLLVAAGKVAAEALLECAATPLTKLRGTIHRRGNLPLLVMYHPAYFLRRPTEKKHGWIDLLAIKKFLHGE